MPLVTDLELPALDPSDPTLKGDAFHDALRTAADGGWLASAPLGFVVLDREAGSFFLRTKQATFPGLKIAELFGIDEGPLAEEIQANILHRNGADHARLRNLVNPAFTPRAAARWRDAMREELARLWGQWGRSGRCEVVEQLAKPYPSVVIARVVGADRADAPRLHHWSNWIQRQFDGPSLMNDREQIEQATAEFYEWAEKLIADHRAQPRDDLVSQLVAAEEEGDRLSDRELVNLVLNVFVGGVDTTQSQLAQALRLFCAHPEQWDLLAGDPELVPRAIDEVVRFEPITPFTARIVEEEIEFRDVVFPVGTVVLVSAWNGNRDGVDAPQEFDITAERGSVKPLTFGAGVHYCLGANLARAELDEALTFLAPRMRGLRLDGDVELGTVQGIYGVDRLPVAFTPGEGV